MHDRWVDQNWPLVTTAAANWTESNKIYGGENTFLSKAVLEHATHKLTIFSAYSMLKIHTICRRRLWASFFSYINEESAFLWAVKSSNFQTKKFHLQIWLNSFFWKTRFMMRSSTTLFYALFPPIFSRLWAAVKVCYYSGNDPLYFLPLLDGCDVRVKRQEILITTSSFFFFKILGRSAAELMLLLLICHNQHWKKKTSVRAMIACFIHHSCNHSKMQRGNWQLYSIACDHIMKQKKVGLIMNLSINQHSPPSFG